MYHKVVAVFLSVSLLSLALYLYMARQTIELGHVVVRAPTTSPRKCAVYEAKLPGSESWLAGRIATNRPTHDDLYKLIYNIPYSPNIDVILNFYNYLNATAYIPFEFSNLAQTIDTAFDDNIIPILKNNFPSDYGKWFFVEIGSFVGGSAIPQAKKLDSLGFPDVPILCIDSWTGDVGLLKPMFDEHTQLAPPNIPRPQYYSQFMMNVQKAIQDKEISPTHIVPLNLPSISGVRWMATAGILPHYIYLDSAHYPGETLLELRYCWEILRPGGLIVGDDYHENWEGVVDGVNTLASEHGINVGRFGPNQWYVEKPL